MTDPTLSQFNAAIDGAADDLRKFNDDEEREKMNAILRAFGRLVCGVTRRHVWSRTYRHADDYKPTKFCKRCGLDKPVNVRGPRKAKS